MVFERLGGFLRDVALVVVLTVVVVIFLVVVLAITVTYLLAIDSCDCVSAANLVDSNLP